VATTSTIFVDDREDTHSHPVYRTTGTDMLSLLRSHRATPLANHKHLVAGDFCFVGEGPKGPCLIGIERKRLHDILNCLRTHRFVGEQLPKLIDHYEYVYLVIEGRYQSNWSTGLLEERRGKLWSPVKAGQESYFLSLELDSFLNSLSLSPVRIKRTADEKETVDWIVSLHHTFSKPWQEHGKKLAGIHTPAEYAIVGKASTVRRVAYTLTKVGWERSGAVEQHFKNVHEMCDAEVKDWMKVDGFGKVLSNRVYRELRGEVEPDSKGGL